MRKPMMLWTTACCLVHLAAAELTTVAAAKPSGSRTGTPIAAAAEPFQFHGDVMINGVVVGQCRFAAEAKADAEGKPAWLLNEAFTMGEGAAAARYQATAWLDAEFRPGHGELHTNRDGQRRHYRWQRTRDGFQISEPAATTAPLDVQHAGDCTVTMSAAILSAKGLLQDSETYQTRQLDPGFDPTLGELPLASITLRNQGAGDWQGGRARLVTGRRDDTQLTFAFATDSPHFLGLRVQDGHSMPLEFVRQGTARSRPATHRTTKLAATPRAAALKAALALATGDRAMLDKSIHWPSFRQRLGAAIPADIPLEQFRTSMLDQLSQANAEPQPRAMTEAVLSAVMDDLKIESQSDTLARVTFPDSFQRLQLIVQHVDTGWHLVGLGGG